MADSTIKQLEQIRAKFAFNCVVQVKNTKSALIASDYRSYVKKLPMMIKSNGLGAAITFVYSKKKEGAWNDIYDQLKNWLVVEHPNQPLKEMAGKDTEFADAIISMDSSEYRSVTVETLALLNWLRRFAEGQIPSK